MEKMQLESMAASYLEQEQDPFFSQDMENLLAADDMSALHDRFYTELKFGTAGIRGVIGAGFNRMNTLTVRKVTQGLADYLNGAARNSSSPSAEPEIEPQVVIAFDSRRYSREFAVSAARVLCGNGISVRIMRDICPVPMLSFAVRTLEADAGIVITASHNPPEYNGYKVYWSDGGQVIPPHDAGIADAVARVVSARDIREAELTAAESRGSLVWLEESFHERYYSMVERTLVYADLFSDPRLTASNPVVYTPLHGSGMVPIRNLCRRLGVPLHVVREQEAPDGNFPTVRYPNPEDPDAMKMALDLARNVGAALVLGTDPDADRLGMAVPDPEAEGGYTLLTGNQIAVLLCDYLVNRTGAQLKENSPELEYEPDLSAYYCVKSLVTTDLMRAVAQRNGVSCIDTLTGFKYIAEQINKGEIEGRKFLFGAEESFGYLGNDLVRDKDAVSTAVIAMEMMLWYASKNVSVTRRMVEIRNEYGWFGERVISRTLAGASGLQKIKAIMDSFRSSPPTLFGGLEVAAVTDLASGQASGPEALPPADVVILVLEGGSKLIVRPSGTEPKIKFYIFAGCPADTPDGESVLEGIFSGIMDDIDEVIGR